MIRMILAAIRRARSWLKVKSCRSVKDVGLDVHVGAGTRLWAPVGISIGNGVYIGKNVTIECNADIGDYAMIANNVAFVGRNDHDFRVVGVPIRFSPWIGGATSQYRSERVVVGSDTWIGYGAIVLSGVSIGRGAVVAAGAVVVRDVSSYSIVGGNPAREIGRRFVTQEEIARHETSMAGGRFRSSERGYNYWVVKPAQLRDSSDEAQV